MKSSFNAIDFEGADRGPASTDQLIVSNGLSVARVVFCLLGRHHTKGESIS